MELPCFKGAGTFLPSKYWVKSSKNDSMPKRISFSFEVDKMNIHLLLKDRYFHSSFEPSSYHK